MTRVAGWATRPRSIHEWAEVVVTALVLVVCPLFVLGAIHPSKILLATTPAGGDMGAHVWAPDYLRHHLLAHGRLTGWSPDWYNGFPALTFYFPLPYVVIALLSFVLPYGVAFKMVTVAGLVGLPLAAYAMGRLTGMKFPGPPLLAVATVPFLFDRYFTIWGGNIASTLAGEFAFSIGLSLALLFIGVFSKALDSGRYRWLAALLFAATILCHLLPTFLALVGAVLVWLLQPSRRRFGMALLIGLTGVAVTAFWLVPFGMRLGYSNDMGWERTTAFTKGLFPFLCNAHRTDANVNCPAYNVVHPYTVHLKVVVALAAAGVVGGLVLRRRTTLLIAGIGAAFAGAFRFMPQGTLWNARMLPFWYLSLYLAAAACLAESSLAVGILLGRTSRGHDGGPGPDLERLDAPARRTYADEAGDRHGHGYAGEGDWDGARQMVGDRGFADDRELVGAGVAAPGASGAGPGVGRGADRDPGDRGPRGIDGDLLDSIPPWDDDRGSDDPPGSPGADPPAELVPNRWPAIVMPLLAGLIVLAFIGQAVPDYGGLTRLLLRNNAIGGADQRRNDNFVSGWANWNYSGYERKASYPEYADVISTMARVGRDDGCGRAMWEYESEEDRFGTPMALMLLPKWTHGCIGSQEGLFFESSATVPYHFLNQSELSASGSRAQRDLPYRDFNIVDGIEHLQLLGVRYYMAVSPATQAAARTLTRGDHPQLTLVATTASHNVTYTKAGTSSDQPRTWEIYQVADSATVAPLRFEPVVMTGVPAGGKGWLKASVAWFQDRARWDVPLAASGPRAWKRVIGSDPSPPRTSVRPAVVSGIKMTDDRISFDVDVPGSPVLVKTSYFPNWQATGANGPWRVTPNSMVVIPTGHHVELHYGYTPVDNGGRLLTLVGIGGLFVLWRGERQLAGRRPRPLSRRSGRRRSAGSGSVPR
ncbi:MAG: hypothetical protein NVS3B12_25280 [Acidimicrobiales bacterium]